MNLTLQLCLGSIIPIGSPEVARDASRLREALGKALVQQLGRSVVTQVGAHAHFRLSGHLAHVEGPSNPYLATLSLFGHRPRQGVELVGYWSGYASSVFAFSPNPALHPTGLAGELAQRVANHLRARPTGPHLAERLKTVPPGPILSLSPAQGETHVRLAQPLLAHQTLWILSQSRQGEWSAFPGEVLLGDTDAVGVWAVIANGVSDRRTVRDPGAHVKVLSATSSSSLEDITTLPWLLRGLSGEEAPRHFFARRLPLGQPRKGPLS